MKFGTPLQAIKWVTSCRTCLTEPKHGLGFLLGWLNSDSLAAFTGWQTDSTHPGTVKQITFAEFCKANPDEPERADGRKVHYGSGRQPLDDIIDAGWGAAFCAGNVLKYLRRDKQIEDSRTKAIWYWNKLKELDRQGEATHSEVKSLMKLLTDDELRFLGGVS